MQRTNLKLHIFNWEQIFSDDKPFKKQDNIGFIHKIVRICITWLKNFADNQNPSKVEYIFINYGPSWNFRIKKTGDGWYEQEKWIRHNLNWWLEKI